MLNFNSQLYMLFDKEPTHKVDFVQWLVSSINTTEPVQLLDIGCGLGTLSLRLAQLGWQVHAIEPDHEFFDTARRQAETWDNIQFTCGSFTHIVTRNQYDVITAIESYDYLLTLGDRLQALKAIYQALRPGGLLFLDVVNFLWMMRTLHHAKPEYAYLPDKEIVERTIKYEIDLHTCTYKQSDLFTVDAQLRLCHVHHKAIITPAELIFTLEDTGFKQINMFNSYEARQPQSLESNRLLIMARKPQK